MTKVTTWPRFSIVLVTGIFVPPTEGVLNRVEDQVLVGLDSNGVAAVNRARNATPFSQISSATAEDRQSSSSAKPTQPNEVHVEVGVTVKLNHDGRPDVGIQPGVGARPRVNGQIASTPSEREALEAGQMEADARPRVNWQIALSPTAREALKEMKKLYPGQRVDAELFLRIWTTILKHAGARRPPGASRIDSAEDLFQTPFGTFLIDVFNVATGMMSDPLGEPIIDIGLHCFTYAMVLASEFYFDGENFADKLKLMEQGPDSWPTSDWHSRFLLKDHVKGIDRVTRRHFREFFSARFKNELKVPIDLREEYDPDKFVKKYENYLHSVFDVAWDMMKEKPHRNDYLTEQGEPTLGEHCFRYAALLAGEFYFTPGVYKGGFHDSLGVMSQGL